MQDYRATAAAELGDLLTCAETDIRSRARALLAPDASWHVSSPIGDAVGPEAVVDGFVLPLRAALSGCQRRDILFIGGQNRRQTGGQWVASLTHYVGTFSASLGGLRPSGKLAFLRSGEFYQIEAGRIARAHIILDLLDLARQSGRMPLPPELGTEIVFPAPATQDGLFPVSGDGAASLDLVEAMLGDLHDYDPATSASPGQTGPDGHWAEDFLWYGPGGIGSTYRWDGFVADHRKSFLHAFPDRKGGDHYCRIGDGDYAAISGWPSMTMTHRGDYLGVRATGKPLTLRVMDFYRTATGPGGHRQIAENWVCLDYVDLFSQMGVDLIARANAI
ncbi:MAG: ester cyclase [Paracoccaceae bacterium]|nr:ester cyclase [Paracoccaceae bacterium]